MANAKKCDRCKQYYDPYNGVLLSDNPKKHGNRINRITLCDSFNAHYTVDLCQYCVIELAGFLNLPKGCIKLNAEEDREKTKK